MDVVEVPVEQLEVALDAGNEIGEGPIWDDREGVLWWVDIVPGQVHRWDPAGGSHRIFDAGEMVGAVALRESSPEVVLAVRSGFALLDPRGGEVRPLVSVEADMPGNRMNDGYCDARGRFWAGTMSIDESSSPQGSLYRLDPDLRVTRVLEGVGISNGIDWTADGKTMYFADTKTPNLDAFDFDLESGTIANRRVVATVPANVGSPDGLVLDAEDCAWVAIWGGGQVRRYRPDGTLDRVVHVDVSRVTKVAFGGPDLDEMYITTAWIGASEAERREQPRAGHIFRCRPGVRGRRPHRFAG